MSNETKKIVGYRDQAEFIGDGLDITFRSKCKSCAAEWDHTTFKVTAVAPSIEWYDSCSECVRDMEDYEY